MSWERDPLWAKARLFLEHAFRQDREDPQFGLWCALGLELLARSALSSISPTLLAEPDKEQKNLLYALKRGDAKTPAQSISCARVFRLCRTQFSGFTDSDLTNSLALVNRRNAELHSGEDAFGTYTTRHWVPGFYGCCKVLAEAMGENLESLFGPVEAAVADEVLAQAAVEVRKRVFQEIANHKAIFLRLSESEQAAAQQAASESAKQLAFSRHHKVKCPACSALGTLQGDTHGESRIEDQDGEIVVKQTVTPRIFSCAACGLKLNGFAELSAAELGDQYTRTSRYSPEEYYELINPDDHETLEQLARDALGMRHPADREYDNE